MPLIARADQVFRKAAGDDIQDPRIRSAVGASLEELAAQVRRGPALSRELLSSLSALDQIPWSDITRRIEQILAPAMGGAAADAGQAGLEELSIRRSFTIDNPFAQAWAASHSGAFAEYLVAGSQASVRTLVARALRDGIPPRQLAIMLETAITLHPTRATTLASARAALIEAGASATAIDRQLRARGRSLRSNRWLMIARTETTTAQANGLLAAWESAQADGDLPRLAVKEWIAATESPRTSDICLGLDGQRRLLDRPFTSSLVGEVMAPSAHPHCRSTLGLRTVTQAEFDRIARLG